jgi:hypothetical protein
MGTTFDQLLEHFEKKQVEIMDLARELENKKQLYKAETKQAFGLADGETIDIISVIKAIRKVQGMA